MLSTVSLILIWRVSGGRGTPLTYELRVQSLKTCQISLEYVVKRARYFARNAVTDTPSVLNSSDRSIFKLHTHP